MGLGGGLVPCPRCQTHVITRPSAAGTPIILELAPAGLDCKTVSAFVLIDGVAFTVKVPKPGATVYLPHVPRCKAAA